jgi:Ca2+/H+ antiporter
VFAAVFQAEITAHRVGELFGTLVLAVAVTVIEVSLIVFVMLGGGLRMTPAWLVGDGLGFFQSCLSTVTRWSHGTS